LDYINLTIEQEFFVSNQRSCQSSEHKKKNQNVKF